MDMYDITERITAYIKLRLLLEEETEGGAERVTECLVKELERHCDRITKSEM